jgi:hypothetical protein
MSGTAEAAGLKEAFHKLEETAEGKSIAADIRDSGTRIRFGETEESVIAQFDSLRNQIIISERCENAPSNVLAAHLAHEGVHVQWGESDSIDQEYHAFRAQAAVWNELKGEEANPQCDAVSRLIAMGEKAAKEELSQLYPELPRHGPTKG